MKFVLILLGISAPIVIHNYFVDALIGGEPARLGEVPYIVQVLALDTRSGHYSRLCDGALMDQFNFVLPGHCAYSCRAFQNCRAYAGRLGTTGGGVELTIIKINVHKLIEAFYANGSFRLGSDPWYIWDFKPTPRIADIGLINTEYVPFDENVSAAKPPKTEVPANNNDDIYNVTVSGWGANPMLRVAHTQAKACQSVPNFPTGWPNAMLCLINLEIRNCFEYGAPMILESTGELIGIAYLHVMMCIPDPQYSAYRVLTFKAVGTFIEDNLIVGHRPTEKIEQQSNTGLWTSVWILITIFILAIIAGVIYLVYRRLRSD